jgi:Domain of unknown function (DUF4397)
MSHHAANRRVRSQLILLQLFSNPASASPPTIRPFQRHQDLRMYSALTRIPLAALLLVGLLLIGCGGSDNNSASVRFVNATTDVGGLDLYTGDDKRASNVAPDAVSDYASIDEGSYTAKIKLSGNDSALISPSVSLTGDNHYAAVAWGRSDAVRLAVLTEEEDEPSAAIAEVRIFNGATDVGKIDAYLTDPAAALDTVSANASSISTGSVSGYAELAKGTYRLRITAAGDKTDVRLDIASITLADKDRVTIILQPTPGGVLAHSLLLVQQGALTVNKNTYARARAVASVSGNGVVAAKVGSTSLSAALTSPAVGNYVLVPSGSQTLLAQVNGATVSSASTTFAAGGDYTVFLYGGTSSAQLTLLSDDNRLPTDSSKAKMRLVHGGEGYSSLSLALDSVSVASEVPFGQASTFTQVTPNKGNALVEVTSALSNTPLYTTVKTSGDTGVSIDAQSVYTVFMLGGNAAPRGLMRKER